MLVDLNRVDELDFIHLSDGEVRIGAMTKHRAIELDPELASAVPLLIEAASYVGHPQIRNRATVGGTLAHADPSAELSSALLALGARVTARKDGTQRDIAMDSLCTGFFETCLHEQELLVSVTVPLTAGRSGSAFTEFAERHGDFAIAGIAVHLGFDDDGTCREAHAAGGGVGSKPIQLEPAVDHLPGERNLSDAALDRVAAQVGTLVEPLSDVRGSSEYRRELAQVLAVQAVRLAWQRAQEG
jgi:CO/xanthine dehydrogenase FAD-binding subunit